MKNFPEIIRLAISSGEYGNANEYMCNALRVMAYDGVISHDQADDAISVIRERIRTLITSTEDGPYTSVLSTALHFAGKLPLRIYVDEEECLNACKDYYLHWADEYDRYNEYVEKCQKNGVHPPLNHETDYRLHGEAWFYKGN